MSRSAEMIHEITDQFCDTHKQELYRKLIRLKRKARSEALKQVREVCDA